MQDENKTTYGAGEGAVHPNPAAGQPLVGVSDAIERAVGELDSLSRSRLGITGAATGFDCLDRITTGWKPGELGIVSVSPDLDKRDCMIALALGCARHAPSTVYVSCQTTADYVAQRMLLSEAGIARSAFAAGSDQQTWQELADAMSFAGMLPLFITDWLPVDLGELSDALACKGLSSKGEVVVVEDIMALRRDPAADGRQQIAQLLYHARQNGTSVILGMTHGSEAWREVEGQGALLEGASVVVRMEAGEGQHGDPATREVIAHVCRSVHGSTGSAKMLWNAGTGALTCAD